MIRHQLALTTAIALLAMSVPAWADAPKQLPEPNYEAIERAAQRTEPGQDYAKNLPARLRECTASADPYARSSITADMVASKVICMVCLRAMMRKLAELYYVPDAFGPGGIDACMDEMAKPFYKIIYDVHTKRVYYDGDKKVPECGDLGYCGSIEEQLLPRDDYVDFLMDFVRYVAGYGPFVDDRTREWYDAWVTAGRFDSVPPE